jgi:hypothetical protein
MKLKTLIPITRQTPGVVYPGKADELWLVPQKFEVLVDDGSLPYELGFTVGQPDDSGTLAIIELHIYRITQPIHSTGLRELHLPELLEQAIRSAAKYLTKDNDFGGMWVIDETKASQPIPIDGFRKLTRRIERKNTPQENDAQFASRLVKQLKRDGVPDWEQQACNELGISRSTLFRRCRLADQLDETSTKGGK